MSRPLFPPSCEMALRIWLNEKVGFHPTFSRHGIAQSLSALALRIWLNEKVRFAASVFGGVGDGKKEMLRKKYHVVRKKYHVVRKLFYVASIFGGAARRRNRPPWELSSTPWDVSSTAGDFSPTASSSEATPSMRLPSTRLFWGRSYKFTGHQYVNFFHLCHSLLPAPLSALRSFHAELLIGASSFRQAKEQ